MLDELNVKHNPDLILPRKRIFKNGTSTFSVRSDLLKIMICRKEEILY